jgi:outer membrane putative beta-barrel porin/alpha-amylase
VNGLRPLALCALAAPLAALAGPPFLTDDPQPTDTRHWEIYAPLFEAEGRGSDVTGSFGVELNYGAAPNLQLTAGLAGETADIELSAKYRFYDDEDAGFHVAVFPGVTLPTARDARGAATGFLPIWAQKDFEAWSVFGGGGYTINPGPGSRDYWTGGIAVTRSFGERLLVGAETYRQGRDAAGSTASTSFGVGAIYDFPGPLRLLASVGPTHEDGGASGFHAFVALGLDL